MPQVCTFYWYMTSSVLIHKVYKKILQYIWLGHKWIWENIWSSAISTVLMIISSKPTPLHPYFIIFIVICVFTLILTEVFIIWAAAYICGRQSCSLKRALPLRIAFRFSVTFHKLVSPCWLKHLLWHKCSFVHRKISPNPFEKSNIKPP